MKTLKETILLYEIENILLDNLIYSLKCRMNCQPQIFGIYEGLGNFLNCGKVLDVISKYFVEEIDETKLEKDKEVSIDVSNCEAFCKVIHIKISDIDSKDFSARLVKLNKSGDIWIDIEIDFSFKIKLEDFEGMILHELMHAYEEFNRISNDKKSIFDELTIEYQNAKRHLSRKSEDIQLISSLKYYIDYIEQRANFGTLEYDIKKLIEKIDPERTRMRTNKIKEELKNSGIWKKYFDFYELTLRLDDFSDKILENAYYIVTTSDDEQIEYLKNHIENLKKGLESKKYKVIKKAKDIRKEIKSKTGRFINKFNTLFAKIYCEHILNNKDIGITSYKNF